MSLVSSSGCEVRVFDVKISLSTLKLKSVIAQISAGIHNDVVTSKVLASWVIEVRSDILVRL